MPILMAMFFTSVRKIAFTSRTGRNRPLQGGRYPYVYMESIYPRRNWGGEHENVAILVAIAVK